ncbi:MAG: ion channel [Spirochaetia bacterium]|nr:ion channel [Spirochaetia bacterium]
MNENIEKKLSDIKSIFASIEADVKNCKPSKDRSKNIWENIAHFILGFMVLFLGLFAICLKIKGMALIAIILVNIYLVILICECAVRSMTKKNYIPLPDRTLSLFLMICLLISTVTSFGELYLDSGEVIHTFCDKKPTPQCDNSNKEVLSNEIDAIYFSAVTITTLGYGDYAPAGTTARCYVVWELVSGLLILLLIFPIVVNRISNLD